MSIAVGCKCGTSFKAPDELAGKRAKCSRCGAILDIPKGPPDLHPTSGVVAIEDLEEGMEEDRLGIQREATLTDVWKVLNKIAGLLDSSATSAADGGQQREYKVITQKDKWFSGKFDPEKVEGALNAYAKQGWVLKGVATASVPGFGGQREEIVIILER